MEKKKTITPHKNYLLEEVRNHTGWIYATIGLISGSGAVESAGKFLDSGWFILVFCFFISSLLFLLSNMWLTVVIVDTRIKNSEYKIGDCSKCFLKMSFHLSFIFTVLGILGSTLILILNYVGR